MNGEERGGEETEIEKHQDIMPLVRDRDGATSQGYRQLLKSCIARQWVFSRTFRRKAALPILWPYSQCVQFQTSDPMKRKENKLLLLPWQQKIHAEFSPSLMEKLWRRARPSNQWLYLLSPTVCIPGPFRSRVPCSHAGILPVKR